MSHIKDLLELQQHDVAQLTQLLSVPPGEQTNLILERGLAVKSESVGRKVYLRGLIELTNRCRKNCFYCGIRAGNALAERYTLTDDQALECARFAWEQGFGSLVIQTGELTSKDFVVQIENLLRRIHRETRAELTITLSCGEQPAEVYRRWFEAGASRYLLRIETSNRRLFETIHPRDEDHRWEDRIAALENLRLAGFQVGTGVMIGLPGQTLEDLARDLLFFRQMDVDMVGMGPYIEHIQTPMYARVGELWPGSERFRIALLMIALLRINMPLINIAASTALETLDPLGRQKGLLAGANVVMPNLTPVENRKKYLLYSNKPNLDKDAALSARSLSAVISAIGEEICYHQPGNSQHFVHRTSRQ
ncbi:MAG: [FeFe] hydrogenase H-cluster radical SAM maturase HydE [Bacteroidetes bacterium]|nr:[FeFe] hydrogenase H-cluster radical SAM maturase HydE [Bacteroidota bacterium]